MDKITELFMEEPEKEFHAREISRLAKLSPTTSSKYLNILLRRGIVTSRKMTNLVLFKADTENLSYKAMKRSYNLQRLNQSGLINHLVEEYNEPEAIVLFGSFDKGEDSKRSDIDLLVVTPLKKTVDVALFEKKLKRTIQIFVHPKKEIESMKTKNKRLLNNLVNGSVIYGYWEAFR